MRGFLLLLAAGTIIAMLEPQPASAATAPAVNSAPANTTAAAPSQKCLDISGTADGFDKPKALAASRESLQDAINTWKAQNHVSAFQTTPWKPDPKPYWRMHVAPEIVLKPDEVTDQIYSICWPGVISPVVCTSGSKVCY